MTGYAYDKCTACSKYVRNSWIIHAICNNNVKNEQVQDQLGLRGNEFLVEVINDPDILEKITGLDAMKKELGEDVAWEDDEWRNVYNNY